MLMQVLSTLSWYCLMKAFTTFSGLGENLPFSETTFEVAVTWIKVCKTPGIWNYPWDMPSAHDRKPNTFFVWLLCTRLTAACPCMSSVRRRTRIYQLDVSLVGQMLQEYVFFAFYLLDVLFRIYVLGKETWRQLGEFCATPAASHWSTHNYSSSTFRHF